MKMSATKIVSFSTAHQLSSAYSKECVDSIHGHNYKLEVTFCCNAECLNKDGMVIDFKELKELLQPVIDKYDHQCFTIDTYGVNPTAENMCRDIFEYLKSKSHLVEKIKLWETDTSYCEVCH